MLQRFYKACHNMSKYRGYVMLFLVPDIFWQCKARSIQLIRDNLHWHIVFSQKMKVYMHLEHFKGILCRNFPFFAQNPPKSAFLPFNLSLSYVWFSNSLHLSQMISRKHLKQHWKRFDKFESFLTVLWRFMLICSLKGDSLTVSDVFRYVL